MGENQWGVTGGYNIYNPSYRGYVIYNPIYIDLYRCYN